MNDMVSVQDIILRSCQHTDRQRSETRPGNFLVCCACWNRGYYARRAARKAQLACRANDCQRCAQKPVTKLYGGFRLCGRCFTAVKREHNQNAAGCSMPWLITRLLVDTKEWASNKSTQESQL